MTSYITGAASLVEPELVVGVYKIYGQSGDRYLQRCQPTLTSNLQIPLRH